MARDIGVRVVERLSRRLHDPDRPESALLEEMRHSPGLTAQLSQTAPSPELEEEPLFAQRLLRVNLNLVPLLGVPHWRGLRILPDHAHNQLTVSMRLPDGDRLMSCCRRAAAPLAFAHIPGGVPADDVGGGRVDVVGGATPDRAGTDLGGGRGGTWVAM